jgi:hypothetical protein
MKVGRESNLGRASVPRIRSATPRREGTPACWKKNLGNPVKSWLEFEEHKIRSDKIIFCYDLDRSPQTNSFSSDLLLPAPRQFSLGMKLKLDDHKIENLIGAHGSILDPKSAAASNRIETRVGV